MARLVSRRVRRLTSWRPGAVASRRASIALAVLVALTCGLAVAASRAVSAETLRAESAAATSRIYQDARFDVARQDAQLNEYLLTGDPDAKTEYEASARALNLSLARIASDEDAPAIRDLQDEQREYTAQATRLFSLIAAGQQDKAADFQRLLAEPILVHMTSDLGQLEAAHHESASAQLRAVRLQAKALQLGTPSVLALVVLLLVGLSLVTRGYRRKIEDQATHDALTGVPNRLLFTERASQALVAASRVDVEPVVIMLDLDRFKEVNDTLGHFQGDRLLVEVAERIAGVLRAGDTLARLGGDEFAVLLPAGGATNGTQVAERIGAALEPAFYLDGVTVSVEASMGIATASLSSEEMSRLRPADRAAELLRHADIAMYDAKLERCGYVHFREVAREGARPARLALLGELREALNRDELVLHYQPKIAALTGELMGVEALVRWNHPTRGLLAPGEFIELAERTTLIQRLTMIVVEKALGLSRQWLDDGVRLPVAVNVSARSLLDLNFPATIAAQLTRAGLSADHLCLELTESTIMADPDRALIIMQELREMGIRLSVDDFGTGYSSMAYLKILPVDELKVDRSFVAAVTTSADDSMLVQSAIDLGHNLGMSVVAEGVEDRRTLERLRELGADEIQGYFLGRPMDQQKLSEWVTGRAAIDDERAQAAAGSFQI